MPFDASAEADARDALYAHLTVVCARTQILQRQVRRLDGLTERDRERLEVGLVGILSSAYAISATLAHMPPAHLPSHPLRPG